MKGGQIGALHGRVHSALQPGEAAGLTALDLALRAWVLQETALTVGVGIGPTKTLAKRHPDFAAAVQ